MKKILFFVLLLVFMASSTIRTVGDGGTYATLADGCSAGSVGDTIQILNSHTTARFTPKSNMVIIGVGDKTDTLFLSEHGLYMNDVCKNAYVKDVIMKFGDFVPAGPRYMLYNYTSSPDNDSVHFVNCEFHQANENIIVSGNSYKQLMRYQSNTKLLVYFMTRCKTSGTGLGNYISGLGYASQLIADSCYFITSKPTIGPHSSITHTKWINGSGEIQLRYADSASFTKFYIRGTSNGDSSGEMLTYDENGGHPCTGSQFVNSRITYNTHLLMSNDNIRNVLFERVIFNNDDLAGAHSYNHKRSGEYWVNVIYKNCGHYCNGSSLQPFTKAASGIVDTAITLRHNIYSGVAYFDGLTETYLDTADSNVSTESSLPSDTVFDVNRGWIYDYNAFAEDSAYFYVKSYIDTMGTYGPHQKLLNIHGPAMVDGNTVALSCSLDVDYWNEPIVASTIELTLLFQDTASLWLQDSTVLESWHDVDSNLSVVSGEVPEFTFTAYNDGKLRIRALTSVTAGSWADTTSTYGYIVEADTDTVVINECFPTEIDSAWADKKDSAYVGQAVTIYGYDIKSTDSFFVAGVYQASVNEVDSASITLSGVSEGNAYLTVHDSCGYRDSINIDIYKYYYVDTSYVEGTILTFLNGEDSIYINGDSAHLQLTVSAGYAANWPGGHVGSASDIYYDTVSWVVNKDSLVSVSAYVWPTYTIDTTVVGGSPDSIVFDSWEPVDSGTVIHVICNSTVDSTWSVSGDYTGLTSGFLFSANKNMEYNFELVPTPPISVRRGWRWRGWRGWSW